MDNVNWIEFVKPELLIVAVVLYFIGLWLKQSEALKDKYIPLVLGIVGVFICGIWVVSTSNFATAQEIAMALFASITQGILTAGLSTYVNQMAKQLNKNE